MAGKKKYEQKAVTSSIRFTSRASINIDGNYYTLEACEERIIPDVPGVNIEEERRLLWDTVNTECDKQVTEIWEVYKTGKKRK